MKVVPVEVIDRFLTCPRKAHFFKTLSISKHIPLMEYYEYVRRNLYIVGLRWTLLYREDLPRKRPLLRSYLTDYKERALRARPSAVERSPGDPKMNELRVMASKEAERVRTFLRYRVPSQGKLVTVARRYILKDPGVSGRMDAVYQDGHNKLHLFKLGFGGVSDKYKDTTYLDALAFKEEYGRFPDFFFLIDLVGRKQRKISLTGQPQFDIIDALRPVVDQIRLGHKYKTPGEQCLTCDFREICDNRK